MGGYCDEAKEHLLKLNSVIDLIQSKLKISEERFDQDLHDMLSEIKTEVSNLNSALDITDEPTCYRLSREFGRMKFSEFLERHSERIEEEKLPEKDEDKPAFWNRFHFRKSGLFRALRYFFDKLAQLASGTPAAGLFGNLSKLFGYLSGVFGLHPYDWTDRVRRVWRGTSLFSRLSSASSNSFGGR